jgi:hypothetical protein
VDLDGDLARAADAAAAFAAEGERLDAVLAAEPSSGQRVYLCSYAGADGRSWLLLDDRGAPVTTRALVREAVSLAALCELADEVAGREPVPRVATLEYLDEAGSPELAGVFGAVESLTQEVEGTYKEELR